MGITLCAGCFSLSDAQPTPPRAVIIKRSMSSKRLQRRPAEWATGLSSRSSLRDKGNIRLRELQHPSVFPSDEVAPHTVSCQEGGDGHTWQRPQCIFRERGLGLSLEELPCAAAAAAAEGAGELWAEEAGDRSVGAAFPEASAEARALGTSPRALRRAAPRPQLWMSLGAPRRTEHSPFCFLRDRGVN